MRRVVHIAAFVLLTLGLQACGSAAELVSTGAQVDTQGDSYGPDISGDGRFIVFTAYVEGLEDKEGDYVAAVFLRDMERQTTALLSRSLNKHPALGGASNPAISADGRYVAYSSGADDIVKGDSNGVVDIFVADLQKGTTRRANLSSSGEQANARTYESFLSSDGRYVLFNTDATNLVEQDGKHTFITHMYDLQSGMISRLDYTAAGATLNDSSSAAVMTSDGCCIVELNGSSNLFGKESMPEDDQIVMRHLASRQIDPVSINTAGEFANNDVFAFSVDGTGHYVVFESRADNLGGDLDGVDIALFLRDMEKKQTRYLDLDRFDRRHLYDGYQLVGRRSLSDDGRYLLVLASRKKHRRSLDAVYDLLVYDMVSDRVRTVASVTSSHGFDAEESVAAISGDGRYIVYSSDATDPDPEKAHHNINKIYRAANPFIAR